MKHRLKIALRELYARLLFHTGLWRLADRLAPRRLVILFGHCVDAPEVNGELPGDMKIGAERLRAVAGWLAARFDARTVGAAARELLSGAPGRSLVAFSMDDGYRDNATHLLPLLRDVGVPATIFVETRPLDERRVSWSHKYFWLLARMDAEEAARRFLERSRDERTRELLRAALAGGRGGAAYRIKRVLKYDAEREDRDRAMDEVFRAAGGDERVLCDRIYMTWDDARRLAEAGWEIGCHTVSHEILARLSGPELAEEIEGAAASLERELGSRGETFAYPFGRRWDYGPEVIDAVRDAGYAVAVNTHAGANTARSPRHELARIAFDDTIELHLVAAEACGGFALLRRLGIDLSE